MDMSILSDNQSEAGAVATVIKHPEFLVLYPNLQPRHFYNGENKCMFEAVTNLVDSGVNNINPLNLDNAIHSNPDILKTVRSYNITDINSYINICQYAARDTIEEYRMLAGNVITMAYKREMLNASTHLREACFVEKNTIKDLNKLASEEVSDLVQGYVISNNLDVFGEKVDSIWDGILRKRTGDGVYGFPSMYPTFGDYFTFTSGELVVYAGRMKSGKSVLMMNETIHMLKSGVPTVYFDSEMSDELFMLRMLANLTQISLNSIQVGTYSKEEEQRIEWAKNEIKQYPFVHVYMPVPDTDVIKSTVKLLKNKMNISFVVYDYIKYNDSDNAAGLSAHLGKLTDFLKNEVAGELDVPVLAGAQLSRGFQLADSDKISRYASTVCIWRKKTADEVNTDGKNMGTHCLSVIVNRNGAQMDDDEYLSMVFNGDTMTIREAKEQKRHETPFD